MLYFPFFPSRQQQQQQQQNLALPPHQTKTDAAAKSVPAGSEEPREETPMEQDAPEGGAKSEPSAADTGEMKESEDAAEHAKMPEHPGRDSDSEEDSEPEE